MVPKLAKANCILFCGTPLSGQWSSTKLSCSKIDGLQLAQWTLVYLMSRASVPSVQFSSVDFFRLISHGLSSQYSVKPVGLTEHKCLSY